MWLLIMRRTEIISDKKSDLLSVNVTEVGLVVLVTKVKLFYKKRLLKYLSHILQIQEFLYL